MAEGFLRHFGGANWEAYSAGTRPCALNPMASEVMQEVGIDISHQRSKHVSGYAGRSFAHVITVCGSARESCPLFPGAPAVEHWPIEDPAAANGSHEQRLQVFRAVRNQIGRRVRDFIAVGER
jgi:arsenate reductase